MLSKQIKAAAIGKMLRVACFVIYYIVLILLGIAVLAGSVMITYFLLAFGTGDIMDGNLLAMRRLIGVLVIT